MIVESPSLSDEKEQLLNDGETAGLLGLPGEDFTTTQAETAYKETVLTTGRSFASFVIPYSKRTIYIYPKPQGYFYRIDHAVNDYVSALIDYARVHKPVGRWRLIKRFLRRGKQASAVVNLEAKMLYLVSLILADKYNPERHQEISREEFYSIGHDMLTQMLDAYRRVNNIQDILEKLIPNYNRSDVKKNLMTSGAGHAFTAR